MKYIHQLENEGRYSVMFVTKMWSNPTRLPGQRRQSRSRLCQRQTGWLQQSAQLFQAESVGTPRQSMFMQEKSFEITRLPASLLCPGTQGSGVGERAWECC